MTTTVDVSAVAELNIKCFKGIGFTKVLGLTVGVDYTARGAVMRVCHPDTGAVITEWNKANGFFVPGDGQVTIEPNDVEMAKLVARPCPYFATLTSSNEPVVSGLLIVQDAPGF